VEDGLHRDRAVGLEQVEPVGLERRLRRQRCVVAATAARSSAEISKMFSAWTLGTTSA
jgi:hypothetical protein